MSIEAMGEKHEAEDREAIHGNTMGLENVLLRWYPQTFT
jgi:hypothetical protein